MATPVSGMSDKSPFREGCTVSTNLHCRCSWRGDLLKAFKFTAVVPFRRARTSHCGSRQLRSVRPTESLLIINKCPWKLFPIYRVFTALAQPGTGWLQSQAPCACSPLKCGPASWNSWSKLIYRVPLGLRILARLQRLQPMLFCWDVNIYTYIIYI